ncbi:hypothetical protein KCV87_14625 [Actinosynnema pretiosum subsp. pretiosum]|uniref:Uncharacterized protein n=1 Tax=Actinosynnema pretiosum subsp. pretiosum TaxID=103721 RepID=A0AA45LCE6_9PSEU|nr:hypothetical protein KCV87_14625 [Actinosynnema pretiosum subsp. pretiosum]
MRVAEEAKPLFDVGDWIAMGAAAVAVLAMAVAIWQASEARKSRRATEKQASIAEEALAEAKRSAAATERANEISLLRDADQRVEREDAAVAEARQVRGKLGNMGGLSLAVVNHGSTAVHDLLVESVEAIGFPHMKWRAKPGIARDRTTWETLRFEETVQFYVDFTDENGAAHRAPSREYYFTISYTTSTGRWRRTGNADPVRVEQPGPDAQGREDAEGIATASASDRALRLLRILADHLAAGTPLNVHALPDQLGLPEAVVEQALQHLHKSGFINALTGDDTVQSVREVTASGHIALERSGF